MSCSPLTTLNRIIASEDLAQRHHGMMHMILTLNLDQFESHMHLLRSVIMNFRSSNAGLFSLAIFKKLLYKTLTQSTKWYCKLQEEVTIKIILFGEHFIPNILCANVQPLWSCSAAIFPLTAAFCWVSPPSLISHISDLSKSRIL